MAHLLILYNFIVLLLGVASLTYAANVTLLAREGLLRSYLLFFILFSASILLRLLEYYLSSNLNKVPFAAELLISASGMLVDMAVVLAAVFFFHTLFSVRQRKRLNILFSVFIVSGIIVFLSPLAVRIDLQRQTMESASGMYFGLAVYIISFSYVLVLALANQKKMREKKNRIFSAGMTVFLFLGYSEMLIKEIGHFCDSELSYAFSFYYSTLPYAAWSIFSLFYFRKYYGQISPEQKQVSISGQFTDKYGISKREGEIIELIIQGFSNKAIADKLFISLGTVKSHIHNIFDKTGAGSRMNLFYLIRSEKC